MYYPKSQIITNQYSKGELINPSTGENYVGFYWETATGKYFAGKYPNGTTNQTELIKSPLGYVEHNKNYQELEPQYYNFSSKNLTYLKLKNIPNPNAPGFPKYSLNIPTEQNYIDGEFTRFFCRKRNNYFYLEIDKKTYNKIQQKDKSIDFTKFISFTLPWVIKGNQNQVAIENKNAVSHREAKLGHKNLGLYLKNNYLQFYK